MTTQTNDLAATLTRSVELRLTDVAYRLRYNARTITSDGSDQAERDEAAADVAATLTGLGTALRQLADHATAEGNRIAAAMDAEEQADPALIDNPTADRLARDEVRLAMFDLAAGLRAAQDDVHQRIGAANTAAHRDVDID